MTLFGSEIFFLEKFGPKKLNCLFKIKFGTQTCSNMLDSMMMFKFSLLDEKWSFLGMFSPKNYNWLFKMKFGTLINLNMLNLSWSRLFYFRPEILFLWANLIKKFEIVCLRLNFVPRLRTLIMMFISFVLDQKYSFWEYWS